MTSRQFLARSFKVERVFSLKKLQRQPLESGRRMGQNRTSCAKHLVVTFPVPQVIELFDRSDLTLDPLQWNARAVRYTRCIALLGLLSGSSNLDHPERDHPVSRSTGYPTIKSRDLGNPPVLSTFDDFPRNTGILRTKNEVR